MHWISSELARELRSGEAGLVRVIDWLLIVGRIVSFARPYDFMGKSSGSVV